MSLRSRLLTLLTLLCVGVLPVHGEEGPPSEAAVEPGSGFAASASLGYLTGESGEFVFDAGEKLSQLDWEIESALIGGLWFSYSPEHWLTFNAGGWRTFTSDNLLTDHDWLDGFNGFDSWTDRSIHPNTDMPDGYQIDARFDARFMEFHGVTFSGLVGFRFLKFKWKARDGTFIYSSDTGFRDDRGSFNGTAIVYEQRWRTPYLGLAADYSNSWLRLRTEILGSVLVEVRDRDLHVFRDILFKEEFDTSMIGVSLHAEHDLSTRLTLFARTDFQNYWRARDDLEIRDLTAGTVDVFRNAAGIDHHSWTISAGIKADF